MNFVFDNVNVFGDEFLLGLLVCNFVENVICYIFEYGVVVVFIEQMGEYCVFMVEDFGFGIFNDLLDCVFDCFYWVIGSGVEGSGLGLFIVQEILDVYGGEISFGML